VLGHRQASTEAVVYRRWLTDVRRAGPTKRARSWANWRWAFRTICREQPGAVRSAGAVRVIEQIPRTLGKASEKVMREKLTKPADQRRDGTQPTSEGGGIMVEWTRHHRSVQWRLRAGAGWRSSTERQTPFENGRPAREMHAAIWRRRRSRKRYIARMADGPAGRSCCGQRRDAWTRELQFSPRRRVGGHPGTFRR